MQWRMDMEDGQVGPGRTIQKNFAENLASFGVLSESKRMQQIHQIKCS